MCVGRIKPPSAAVLVQKAREGRVPVPWLVVVEAVGGWWLVVGWCWEEEARDETPSLFAEWNGDGWAAEERDYSGMRGARGAT